MHFLHIVTTLISLIWIHHCVQGLIHRPLVGILSQPMQNGDENSYYIAASYVKWLESAGARSIPIPYDANKNLVLEIFHQLNGVLFPGGSADLPPSARYIWDLAVHTNLQRGDYFPIWGTCLGFEFMLMLSSEKGIHALESGYKAENISLPLLFPTVEDVRRTEGIFSSLSQLYSSIEVRKILSEENVTMNNHHQGISPEAFLSDQGITSLFHATSTNVDASGRPFISTIESFILPFYGTQYHPEKNNFEYANASPLADIPYENINHSENAIYVSQHLANFFVRQTRKNNLGRYNLTDRHPLIMTYNVTHGLKFEQIYVIPSASHWVSREMSDLLTSSSSSSLLRGSAK